MGYPNRNTIVVAESREAETDGEASYLHDQQYIPSSTNAKRKAPRPALGDITSQISTIFKPWGTQDSSTPTTTAPAPTTTTTPTTTTSPTTLTGMVQQILSPTAPKVMTDPVVYTSPLTPSQIIAGQTPPSTYYPGPTLTPTPGAPPPTVANTPPGSSLSDMIKKFFSPALPDTGNTTNIPQDSTDGTTQVPAVNTASVMGDGMSSKSALILALVLGAGWFAFGRKHK
jgi:hypothetical protein